MHVRSGGAHALLIAQHTIREELVHTREEWGRHLKSALAPPLHYALLQPRHDSVYAARASRSKHACMHAESATCGYRCGARRARGRTVVQQEPLELGVVFEERRGRHVDGTDGHVLLVADASENW
jgi:hypothetical protein